MAAKEPPPSFDGSVTETCSRFRNSHFFVDPSRIFESIVTSFESIVRSRTVGFTMMNFRLAIVWLSIVGWMLIDPTNAFVAQVLLSTRISVSGHEALPSSRIWGFPEACTMSQPQQFVDIHIDGGLLMWFLTFTATVAWLSTLPTPNRDSSHRLLEPATALALASNYSFVADTRATPLADRETSGPVERPQKEVKDPKYDSLLPSHLNSAIDVEHDILDSHYIEGELFPPQSRPPPGEDAKTLDPKPDTILARPSPESTALVKLSDTSKSADKETSIPPLRVDQVVPPMARYDSAWSQEESAQRGQIVCVDPPQVVRPERSPRFDHRLVFNVASTIEDRQAMYDTAQRHREEHLEHIRSHPPTWLYSDEKASKNRRKDIIGSHEKLKGIKLVKTSVAPKPSKRFQGQDQSQTSHPPTKNKTHGSRLTRAMGVSLLIWQKFSFWVHQWRTMFRSILHRFISRRVGTDENHRRQTRFLLQPAGPRLPLPLYGRPGPPSAAEYNMMNGPMVDQ